MRFRQYQNENGGVVDAHVVTEATEGKVLTVEGSRQVLAGDVIVKSQNEHFCEVHDGQEFNEAYREVTQDDLDSQDEEKTVDHSVGVQKNYDPSNRTAKDVREYLSQVKSREEYERVVDAERNGRNRQSAVPERTWDDGE